MATLEWEAADPLTLARLSLSRYTRIDALRDLLDRELFHGARFADLRRPSAPLVVMNATDMESGEVFAFTHNVSTICAPISINCHSRSRPPHRQRFRSRCRR
jgi:hypothetical protein